MKLTVSIIYGSVRESRLGIQSARFLEMKLKERDIQVYFIDPMEHPLPFLNKMYKEYEKGEAPQEMEILSKKFQESDAFLIVTGEYNHSFPPALKNTLDHFQSEYYFKPSAIASYSVGSFGGVRAAVQLRTVLGELGMSSIPSMLPFPKVGNMFNADLQVIDDRIKKSTKRFLDEFVWYSEALKAKRESKVPNH